MIEKGPIEVKEKFNPNNFEPIRVTRLNEQIVGMLSLLSQGCSKQEIIETLNLKETTFKSLYRKMPSLPKPTDYEE